MKSCLDKRNVAIYPAYPSVKYVYTRVNNNIRVCMGVYEHHGGLGGERCCMDRNGERKTDGTGRDVCLAGEVNKIEAVL